MSAKTRVLFLSRSLERGGAERQLAALASGLDSRQFEVRILTFYPGGPIWDELQPSPIPPESLNKRGRWEVAGFTRRLIAYLHDWPPDIVHCYLVEPSVFGLIAARIAGRGRVVWGIRASNMDHRHYDRVSAATFRTAAALSRWTDAIIANSHAGRAFHLSQGYRSPRFEVIENGIDVDVFRPDADARCSLRRQWEIGDDETLIGVAARLDPMKGHEVLLRSLPLLTARVPGARVVFVGGGEESFVARLHSIADQLRLTERLIWAGELAGMASIYPAFDVLCSPSVFGEGFSNSIGEAMACAVPCVVTDVGDSAAIVGDAGMAVPPADECALASALATFALMTGEDRAATGRRARHSIERRFPLSMMIDRTAVLYHELVGMPD